MTSRSIRAEEKIEELKREIHQLATSNSNKAIGLGLLGLAYAIMSASERFFQIG